MLEAGDDVPSHLLSNGEVWFLHIVQLLLCACESSVTALKAGPLNCESILDMLRLLGLAACCKRPMRGSGGI